MTAPIAAKRTAVYVNGVDLGAFLNHMSVSGSAAAYDTTTFGKDDHVYIGGLKDGSLSGEGIFDGALHAVDEYLASALDVVTGEDVFLTYPPGDSFGNPGRGLGGCTTKYEADAPIDGIVTVSFEAESNYGPQAVKSLKAKASIASGASTGTALDNAAASLNGGHAVLHVFAQAASALVVKVQHSVDNSTWVDLITFTSVAAAPAAEVKEVTGTVNRYTRYSAAATSGTATIAVGFGRK